MSATLKKIRTGDLVRFCKRPPDDIDHCIDSEWGIGILLDQNEQEEKCHILCEGNFFFIKSIWVAAAEDFWLPGNKM